MHRSVASAWLSADVWQLIAAVLEPNVVACTLRLVNKFMANMCRDCKDVQMSQPVPHHAFVHRWGDERAMDTLSRTKRRQLLILTARSGCLVNLQVAASVASCPLTEDILKAAAAAGHLPICVWLHDSGCTAEFDDLIETAASAGHGEVVHWCFSMGGSDQDLKQMKETALQAAAGSGHLSLCEELLNGGAANRFDAADAAARAGHVELAEWLVAGAKGSMSDEGTLLESVAYGCPLSVLQHFFEARLANYSDDEMDEIRMDDGVHMLVQAWIGLTADWREKFDWLKTAAGCSWTDCEFELADFDWDHLCERPDAVARIQANMDNMIIGGLMEAAARTGNSAVLEFACSENWLDDPNDRMMQVAAERGDVAVFKVLLAADWPIESSVIPGAVAHGQLGFVQWMAGPEAEPEARVAFKEALEDGLNLVLDAVKSGSLELVEWLREQGFPCEGSAFEAAVETGDVPLMERLVSWGCPMGNPSADHKLYQVAGSAGDLVVLRALRRLGCPWDPKGATFTGAVFKGCSLKVLKWMLAEGCPVDWQAAWGAVKRCQSSSDVVAWIKSSAPSCALAE